MDVVPFRGEPSAVFVTATVPVCTTAGSEKGSWMEAAAAVTLIKSLKLESPAVLARGPDTDVAVGACNVRTEQTISVVSLFGTLWISTRVTTVERHNQKSRVQQYSPCAAPTH